MRHSGMVMYRLARLFLVVLLAGGVVVSAGEAALACSCAVGDPASRLAESDAAFVGRLISSAEPVPDSEGNISTGDPVAWVFEVEEAVKGDLETPLTVMSPWSGASCGFEVRIGERIGVLLREDGGWRSGLCSQLDADVLLRAAAPLPTPSCRGMRVFPGESAPRNDPPHHLLRRIGRALSGRIRSEPRVRQPTPSSTALPVPGNQGTHPPLPRLAARCSLSQRRGRPIP